MMVEPAEQPLRRARPTILPFSILKLALMFLIVPNPRVAPTKTGTGEPFNNKPQRNLLHSSSTVFRGPTRVQNACDECRLRKAKCNGQRPCGRCRSRSAICVYDHASSRTSGPLSPAHVAMLRAQQDRLIQALRNMSAVIDKLKACSSSDHSTNMNHEFAAHNPSKVASHAEENDFDLTEILEEYAPCHTDSEIQHTASECAPETGHLHAEEGESNKRRRRDQSPSVISMPFSTQAQVAVTSSCEINATSSGGAETTPEINHAQWNAGLSGSDLVSTDENLQSTINSSADFPHTTYTSFMEMLQSMRKSPTIFTQQIVDDSHQSYFAGGSTTNREVPNFGASPVDLPAIQDSSILKKAQVGPLIDMVDWDASWENCAELLLNNQLVSTSEQEMSRQYELDWSH